MIKTRHNYSRAKQTGLVSLFVVIFAAVLFSIVAVSFAALMNREQRRSGDDELSQSAYDSAMAGVEDAKRVIAAAQPNNNADQAIRSGQCNTVRRAGLAGADTTSNDPVIVQSSAGTGTDLLQAYTCVIISLESDDYEVELETPNQSVLVPLFASGPFSTVEIEWHTETSQIDRVCGQQWPASIDINRLCAEQAWGNPATTPAMMRSQFIIPQRPLNVNDLDLSPAGNTLFLYPDIGGTVPSVISLDRFVDGNGVTSGSNHQTAGATCDNAVLFVGTYRCKAVVNLGSIVPASNPMAFLRLTSLYGPTKANVTLRDATGIVKFNGAQPVVDSTGRANDLYRRVEARLGRAPVVSYPENAVDLTGSLCKNFWVSASSAGYMNGEVCTP